MARPIKETPILFGEEARQFEMQMLHPKRISSTRRMRMMGDYEFMRSKCTNCTF